MSRKPVPEKSHHGKPVAAADLETDPFRYGRPPKAFLAGIHDGKTTMTWWGPDCVLRLLEYLGDKELLVYFHNGGKFDVLGHILPLLDPADIGDVLRIGSRVVKLCWRGIEFRDSYAIVPRPLKDFDKDSIDYRKMESQVRERHRDKIMSYFRKDLTSLFELVTSFIERFGRKLTLGAACFDILRKEFGIEPHHTSRSFDRELRRFYFAGRTQFFSIGRHVGKYRVFDINSAFPFAMTADHWWSQDWKESHRIPRKWKLQSFYCIECEAAACFPLRVKGESLQFPHGFGRYWVSGWELFAAMECKAVSKLRILHVLQPTKVITFKPYVDKFYEEKRTAETKADRLFAKLLLNVPYGKMGQNPANYVETRITAYRDWEALGKDREGWEPIHDDRRGGRTIFERPVPQEHVRFWNVAVSASITGYARAMLFRAMHGAKGLLNCDTDSMICLDPGKIKVGDGLGEWKEEMRCDVVWVGGRKLYVAHNAEYPWHKRKPRKAPRSYLFVKGLGWTLKTAPKGKPAAWKTALKGARLPILDLIAVCEGKRRVARLDAPSYGLDGKVRWIHRGIVRAEKTAGEKP